MIGERVGTVGSLRLREPRERSERQRERSLDSGRERSHFECAREGGERKKESSFRERERESSFRERERELVSRERERARFERERGRKRSGTRHDERILKHEGVQSHTGIAHVSTSASNGRVVRI